MQSRPEMDLKIPGEWACVRRPSTLQPAGGGAGSWIFIAHHHNEKRTYVAGGSGSVLFAVRRAACFIVCEQVKQLVALLYITHYSVMEFCCQIIKRFLERSSLLSTNKIEPPWSGAVYPVSNGGDKWQRQVVIFIPCLSTSHLVGHYQLENRLMN